MIVEQAIDAANDRVQGAGSFKAVLAVALELTPAELRGVCDLNSVEADTNARKATLARRLATALHC